jgi:hypothetical protein
MLLVGCAATASATSEQVPTKPQLQRLAPSEEDLQGFVQVRPAGEMPRGWAPRVWSPQTQTLIDPVSPAVPLEDEVDLNIVSNLHRTLYSQDGLYQLNIQVELCDTSADAAEQLDSYLQSCQAKFTYGTFDGGPVVGDASWVLPATGGTANVMVCRSGKMMIVVTGDLSASAARHQMHINFPKAAVEAVAYQVLLRASQQPQLTGVSVLQARMDVNSHALPKNALQVAGQTYVPVTEFAKAMGMTTHWNTKTGALTLSGKGRKTVTLTADSTAASVGGAKAALTVPVLKQDGQPVMTLADLLTVTGGRITGHSGNNVQVKG